MRQKLPIIGGAIVLCGLAYVWVGWTGPVEGTIEALAEAIESKDKKAVMSHVSPEFTDGHGTTYEELPDLLEEAFDKYDSFKVILGPIEVREGTTSAEADVRFKLVLSYRGMRGYAMGSLNDMERVVVQLERQDDRYLITSAAGVGSLDKRVEGRGR